MKKKVWAKEGFTPRAPDAGQVGQKEQRGGSKNSESHRGGGGGKNLRDFSGKGEFLIR